MTTITKLKAALADLTDHCSPQYSDAVLKIATVIAEMEAGGAGGVDDLGLRPCACIHEQERSRNGV